jgi:MFS family permease
MSPSSVDEQAPLLTSPIPAPPISGDDSQVLRRHSSSQLPPYHIDHPCSEEGASTAAIWTVVPISLLGIFVANADGSLVIASSQQIASEFDALANASWIVTSFTLAQCASQPLYGKLSDIFGRKSNLVVSYGLFVVGCLLCGLGETYAAVLAGRAMTGIGSAGMNALVSIIIADMVSVREVATWRGYVNIAATLGRALGGPAGGWLCDTIGWRWCFHWQVPMMIIALLLILWKLPNRQTKLQEVEGEQTTLQKWKRVDITGATALVAAICSFLFGLDMLAKDVSRVYLVACIVIFIVATVAFCLVEKWWAVEPILPLELIIQRDALTSYLIAGFQMSAQFALFYSVPIYFQVASGSTVSDAGLRMVPAVVGNASAGLLAGYVIQRTGRYKVLTIVGAIAGCIGYVLVLIRWRGATNWWETMYTYLGGFASGMSQSTTFVHIAASLAEDQIAIAGSMLFLAQSLFLLIGLQVSTVILKERLRSILSTALKGVKDKERIISDAASSVESIRHLKPHIRDIVTGAYVDGLRASFAASIVFAVCGVAVAISLRERRFT